MNPEASPETLRILLGPSASAHLNATGEGCFIVAGKQSHPDDPARWILHLIPCDIATADSAVKVAKGEAKARRVKPQI